MKRAGLVVRKGGGSGTIVIMHQTLRSSESRTVLIYHGSRTNALNTGNVIEDMDFGEQTEWGECN